DKPYFVTYGRQSLLTSGDDNYKQAFFIKVNESAADKFYIRVFDADCYGHVDHLFTVYNTETTFSLYGIDDIYPDENLLKRDVEKVESPSGKLLYTKLYAADFDIDNKWITFAEVDKNSGEYLDGNYYFKLIVESKFGTDGNVFDIFISGDDKSNTEIENIEYYTYAPTVRQESLSKPGVLKFFVDGNSQKYFIHNFDMDNAALWLQTSLNKNYKLNSSGDGGWKSNTIDFNKYEINSLAGINFIRLSGAKNDITFFMRDENEKLIPFILPIELKKLNSIPEIEKQVLSTDEWNTKTFDASLSKDADGDKLFYYWEFGDGATGTGARINHTYQKSGIYNCTLLVKDNSGEITNSSIQNFIVKINQTHAAIIGDDILTSSSEVEFDASASIDTDGKIINYEWNFGDGSTEKGIKTKHVYANPGVYKVTLKVTDDSELENDHNSSSIKITVNHKPIADAGPDIITEPGKEIKFNAGNSVDPDGEIILYNWDFGDGNFAEGIESVHVYSNPGKYTVRLKVQDNTKHETAIDFDET
ncbi:MAG: PKD domain-containing protein, partial [Melioribacteraceae bacterium]